MFEVVHEIMILFKISRFKGRNIVISPCRQFWFDLSRLWFSRLRLEMNLLLKALKNYILKKGVVMLRCKPSWVYYSLYFSVCFGVFSPLKVASVDTQLVDTIAMETKTREGFLSLPRWPTSRLRICVVIQYQLTGQWFFLKEAVGGGEELRWPARFSRFFDTERCQVQSQTCFRSECPRSEWTHDD